MIFKSVYVSLFLNRSQNEYISKFLSNWNKKLNDDIIKTNLLSPFQGAFIKNLISDTELNIALRMCKKHFSKNLRMYELFLYFFPLLSIILIPVFDKFLFESEKPLIDPRDYGHLVQVIITFVLGTFVFISLYKFFNFKSMNKKSKEAILSFFDSKGRPFILTPSHHITNSRICEAPLRANSAVSSVEYIEDERVINIYTEGWTKSGNGLAATTTLELAQVLLAEDFSNESIDLIVNTLKPKK